MFPALKKLMSKPPEALRSTEQTVLVGDRTLPITIRENSRATRITLRIEPGGRALKLTVPAGLKRSEVDDFLDRHQGWLFTKLAKFPVSGDLRSGGMISLRGIPHRIVHTGTLRGVTEATEVNGEPILRVGGLEGHVGRRIAAFLKKEARRDLEPLVARHAALIGKPVRSITMKDTRSRWGSCSWEGNLSFSWRIVMAPPSVIDYLAAHEVAHLKEMNHGPKFWALCRKLCPGTEAAQKWLKQHGSQLHAIDFT